MDRKGQEDTCGEMEMPHNSVWQWFVAVFICRDLTSFTFYMYEFILCKLNLNKVDLNINN